MNRYFKLRDDEPNAFYIYRLNEDGRLTFKAWGPRIVTPGIWQPSLRHSWRDLHNAGWWPRMTEYLDKRKFMQQAKLSGYKITCKDLR